MVSEIITGSIEDKLREGWEQERRFFHLRGASRLAIWAIVLIALTFLIDWGIFARTGIPSGFGVLLLLVNLAVLGWVLWFEWLRHLKPFDPVHVALEVEKRHPDLSSRLVSYVQLKEPSADQPNVSPELVAAMRNQAVSLARPLDFREIIDFRQLKNLMLVAATVVLLFGILSIAWGGHFSTLLQRLVGVDASYPTKTTVTKVSGHLVVRIGDSQVIEGKASGVIPEAGRLFIKPADDEGAKWKELPLKRDAGGNPVFSRELKDLTVDLLYYVRIGDHRSGEYRISVIPSPRIVSTEVLQKFEDYINREPLTVDQLNLEVPEGTELTWKLTSDVVLKDFKVETDLADAEPIVVDIDDSGKVVSFFTTADETFRYTFKWVEKASGEDFQFDDVQYSVRVVADTPPDVQMVSPRTGGLATLSKVVELEGIASDDHGPAKAWLVYSVDGGEKEERIEIRDFSKDAELKFAYKWEPKKTIEGLEIGKQVTFALEVSDHYPVEEGQEDDHIRRSATRKLTFVTNKRFIDEHNLKLAAQLEEMRRLRADEKLSSRKVGEIKNQEDNSVKVESE